MAKDVSKPRSMNPKAKAEPSPKPASPLDIMNLMGQAAVKKSQMNGESAAPNDEEDSDNSMNPNSNKSPASRKANRVAAMKEHEKQSGKQLPPQPKVKGM